MHTLHLPGFTLEHFLEHYWQRQPLLIRQGFRQFEDPISPDELAGLACEEQVESRLVYRRDGRWQAEVGPFDSYERLGEREWCLIVQAANHWAPEVQALVEPFSFLPKWRLDDVMISYSTPDGGVGPHIDRYDVFICQGSGRRRWRVGARGNHREFAAHEALLHTDPFEPIIDEVLEAGDILYIPPGFPHDGVTLENAMSFSVGFRAKSACDMFSALADHLIDQELGNELLEDAGRPLHTQQGRIDGADFARIRAQLQAVLDNEKLLADMAGGYLSRTKCQLDLQALESPYEETELADALAGATLVRTGGLRCFYVDGTVEQGMCYVDGERIAFGSQGSGFVPMLCDHERLDGAQLAPWLSQPAILSALTRWLNAGYWYFAD